MARDPSHIVMLGTSLETHGGISSVLKTYRSAGLFDRWPIEFVATHRDGGFARKLAQAAKAFATFLGLLLRHRRAVLHVHSASRASFWRKSVFMALALLARWPVIFHLHGGGFATFYEAECGAAGRAIVRFFLDRAACIVVVSRRWRAWMHGVTRNPRIVEIANPVPLSTAATQERETALVAFAGRYAESKGIHDLLAAIAGLAPLQRELRLECAGAGDTAPVATRARELGIDDRVVLRGWIGPAERERLLARASVFVLPSHAEGLPMSVLEAMAAGCPVVASSVGGVPDLVADGVNGLLVPPRDPHALALAIHRVLRDRELAAQLARAGRETVAQRFAPERSLAPLEALYADLGVVPTPGTHPGDAPRGRTPGTHPAVPITPKLQELP
ncbi:MAG: glycosyltransferase family 4 protein [Betaproteobacteria bacterium]